MKYGVYRSIYFQVLFRKKSSAWRYVKCVLESNHKRGSTAANGPPRLMVTWQKATPIPWSGAVAFLTSIFLGILPYADDGYDDTDNRRSDTGDAHKKF